MRTCLFLFLLVAAQLSAFAEVNKCIKNLQKVKIDPSANASERILNAHYWTEFEPSEFLNKTLTLRSKEKVLVEFEGFPSRAILATISRREVSPGYWVMALKDREGNVSLIDPYLRLTMNKVRCYRTTETVEARKWKDLTGKYSYYDERHQERMSLIRKAMKSPDLFGSKELYDFVESSHVERLLQNWYPHKADSLIQEVKSSLGEKYLAILADPGVACRMEDFIPFAKKYLKKNVDADSFGLRMAYAKDLQARKGRAVYRAMVLSREELASIQKKGIMTLPNLTNPDSAADNLIDHFNETRYEYGGGWRGMINARTTGGTENSQLISITNYELLARDVGYQYSGNRFRNARLELGPTTGHYLYVFQLNTLEISIIRQTGPLAIEDNRRNRIFRIPSKNFAVEWTDPGLEAFVFGSIPASAIVGYKEYDKPLR